MPPRDSQETAKRQPRDSQETAKRQPRDSRGTAGRQPGDGREHLACAPRPFDSNRALALHQTLLDTSQTFPPTVPWPVTRRRQHLLLVRASRYGGVAPFARPGAPRPRPGRTSAAPRPHFGRPSAAPRLHFGRTSAALRFPRPHLGRTSFPSAAPRPTSFPSAAPRPHAHATCRPCFVKALLSRGKGAGARISVTRSGSPL